MWDEAMRDQVIANEGMFIATIRFYVNPSHIHFKGSIQNIDGLSDDLKAIFKTVWEIEPEVLVRMASDRGPFVCQSQSMSLYFAEPTLTAVVS
jgi:ribonucleotide reductase alpha subunit